MADTLTADAPPQVMRITQGQLDYLVDRITWRLTRGRRRWQDIEGAGSIRERVVTVGAGVRRLVDYDRTRRVLLVSTGGGTVTLGTPDVPAVNQGWMLSSGNPLLLDREQHGPLVTQQWEGLPAAGSIAVWVAEVLVGE